MKFSFPSVLIKYCLFLFFVPLCVVKAQETMPAMLSMKGHALKAKANGKNYQLYVSLPNGYDVANAERYTVLYVLDANITYPILHSLHGLLDGSGEIQKIIIVGVGDEDQSPEVWLRSRMEDYTPSADPSVNKEVATSLQVPEASIKTGNAKAFLSAMRTDIIPFINEHYKTKGKAGIAGHSLGGLFVGYSLLNATDVFDSFGICSPSFLWNNGEILAQESAFLAKHKDVVANVFISSGKLEPEIMYPSIRGFIAALKQSQYKAIKLTTHEFDGETHTSVITASLSRMLKVLYGTNRG
nr:alpha/beta hydrolase-fold protein [uncultured Flavobacterium sp.]